MDIKLLLLVFGTVFLAEHVDPKILSYIVGTGFIVIGLWTVLRA